MAALTGPRDTTELADRRLYAFTVAAGVTIYPGALVMMHTDGLAKPGAAATSQIALGRAENGAAAGERVTVRRGVFRWANSAAGDAITAADYGSTVYIVDDQTVAKTNGTNTRSAAGICRGVDTQGVWVET